jgi:hypothetical protein
MSHSHVENDVETFTSTPPGTPRWVKVFALIVLALVVMIGIMLLSEGEHGPDRHIPSADVTALGEADNHTPPIRHGR